MTVMTVIYRIMNMICTVTLPVLWSLWALDFPSSLPYEFDTRSGCFDAASASVASEFRSPGNTQDCENCEDCGRACYFEV